MKKILSEWCKNVKHALIDKSWSNQDLANATGMSREYVCAIINGRVISPVAQKKISDVLNISDEDS